jgi:hypothetical protein
VDEDAAVHEWGEDDGVGEVSEVEVGKVVFMREKVDDG